MRHSPYYASEAAAMHALTHTYDRQWTHTLEGVATLPLHVGEAPYQALTSTLRR